MESLADRVRRLEPQQNLHHQAKFARRRRALLAHLAGTSCVIPIIARLAGWSTPHFEACSTAIRDLDRVIAFERGGSGISSRGVGHDARLCAQLLEEQYDLTIDLQGLLRSGLMTAATRARVRVGMADAREGARWFYTHRVPSLAA